MHCTRGAGLWLSCVARCASQVSGHRGLVPRASISEQHVVCHSPQHTLQDPPELAPPPRGTQDDSPAWDGGQPGQEAAQDDVSATEGRLQQCCAGIRCNGVTK